MILKRVAILLVLYLLSNSLIAQHSTKISHYEITGNKRTRTSVFLREIGKNIGDTIQNQTWSTALWQKRLSGLNLFNYVQVHISNDTVFIHVKERIYFWGLPRLTWADRNFNVWYQTKDLNRLIYGGTIYLNNLWGLNHRLAITAINGYNQSYEIAYQSAFSEYARGWAFQASVGYWSNHELWYKTEENKLRFLHIDNSKAQQNLQLTLTEKYRIQYYTRLEITQGWNHNEIAGLAYMSNPNYLLGDSLQNEFYTKVEFVSDHRDQRDYPSNGYLFRAGVKPYLLETNTKRQTNASFYLRSTYFKSFSKNLVLASGFFSQYTVGTLPYNLSRQLGYQSDYVRGYEPYVAEGNGFVLGKVAIRRAVLNNHIIRIGEKGKLKNYKTIPLSLWFNIFVDAGHILQAPPSDMGNNDLNRKWQNGAGIGLDIIAWYSAMLRMEYSVNAKKEGFFNVAYKNAF